MCNPYDCQGRGQAGLHAPDSSLEVIRSMEDYEAWWVGEWGEGRRSHFPIAWLRTALLTVASPIIIATLFIYRDEQQRSSNLVGVGGLLGKYCLSFVGQRFSRLSSFRVPQRAC